MTIKNGGDYEDSGHALTREALRILLEYTIDAEHGFETRQWVGGTRGISREIC